MVYTLTNHSSKTLMSRHVWKEFLKYLTYRQMCQFKRETNPKNMTKSTFKYSKIKLNFVSNAFKQMFALKTNKSKLKVNTFVLRKFSLKLHFSMILKSIYKFWNLQTDSLSPTQQVMTTFQSKPYKASAISKAK